MTTMNALVMQSGKIHLQTVATPKPGPGQVLVRSLACGICGSDLHLTRHTSEVFGLYRTMGVMTDAQDDDTGIMLGHEFCAEVIDYGPDTERVIVPGTRVTAVPILLSRDNAGIGVTPGLYGAYSEYFILDEALLLRVPEHVPTEAAAITEPLAVGLHAVNRSGIQPGDVALVAGCGPIGLSVMAALRRRGIETIVASDIQREKFAVARRFGATHVSVPDGGYEMALATELAAGCRLVIFECVGMHTLIDDFIKRAPPGATLVVTGVHTADSQVNYAFATVKELDVVFSYYYTPEEFAECLTALGEGHIDWQVFLTARVGIDGVDDAFTLLSQPNDHIKVLVEPWRRGSLTPMR